MWPGSLLRHGKPVARGRVDAGLAAAELSVDYHAREFSKVRFSLYESSRIHRRFIAFWQRSRRAGNVRRNSDGEENERVPADARGGSGARISFRVRVQWRGERRSWRFAGQRGGPDRFHRFTRSTPPNFESEIYTINVDGSGEKRLTDSPGLDALPAWSPDGERIAFATDRDGNWELYVMEADGAAQRRLTNTQEDESSPAWSTGEIYVMNSDASGLTRLTDNPADDSFPAWRP